MTTIQIWAFNEFTAFDAFTQKVIGKTREAGSDYNRANQVKMINLSRDHGLTLEAVLSLVKEYLDVEETVWAKFHNKIFRKNGQLRSGLTRATLMIAPGFFFNFEF